MSLTEAVIGRYVWHNGHFAEKTSAKADLCTHSLHYASSVFDGIRCHNGKGFRLKEHLERLFYSASIMGLRLEFEQSKIADVIGELIEMNDCLEGSAYIRPLVWCSSANLVIKRSSQEKAQIAIFTKKLPNLKFEEGGIDLVLSSWNRAANLPHQCKAAGNYLSPILAKREAERFGGKEALLMDFEGNVAECGSANIFFVHESGTLVTSKPNYCLNGITRQTIIALAKSLNIPVEEKGICLLDMGGFQEAFLTGTSVAVLPVKSLYCPKDGLKLEFKQSAVANLLFNAYFQLISN